MVLHLLVLLLLFFLKLTVPAEQEEGGVPVMLGNTELAEGEADPYTLTEVDMMPSEEPSSSQEAAEAPAVEQPMITQQDEPSLQVKISIFPRLHATSMACRIARSTRLGVV